MKDKAVDGGVTVKDIAKLMAEMRKNEVAYLEVPGLKLTLSPNRPARPEEKPIGPATAADHAKTFAHIEQARVEAARMRREKLEKLRTSAASSVGLGTDKLVADIFESSLETKGPKVD